MSELEGLIRKLAAEEAERIVGEMLPEYIRAVGIKSVDEENPELVDAEEVARIIGKTPKQVYTLARRNLIPSVRLSPRCVRFDPVKVKEVMDKGGLAEPYSRSA